MNSAGQVEVTGVLSDLEDMLNSKRPYGVILTLDDDAIDVADLPGGAIGIAGKISEINFHKHNRNQPDCREQKC